MGGPRMTYGNVANTVEQLTGKDTSQYFEKLEFRAKLEGWSEQQTVAILLLRIEGEAYDFVSQRPDLQKENVRYKDIKKAVLRRFEPPRLPGQIYRLIVQCTQAGDETVREFADKLRKYKEELRKDLKSQIMEPNSNAPEIVSSNLVLTQFKSGLLPHIRIYTRTIMEVTASLTFEGAVEIAEREERTQMAEATESIEINAVRRTKSPAMNIQTSRYRNQGRREIQCSKCKRRGHNQKNCRYNQNCFRCGKSGHIAVGCQARVLNTGRNQYHKQSNAYYRSQGNRCNLKHLKPFVRVPTRGVNRFTYGRRIIVPNINGRQPNDIANLVILKVNNRPLRLLIDTGSAISLVKEAYVEKHRIRRQCIGTLTSISGGELSYKGTSRVQFKKNNNDFPFDCVICPNELALEADGLLGRDFLEQYKAKINYQTNCITLGNTFIKIFAEHSIANINTDAKCNISKVTTEIATQTEYKNNVDTGQERYKELTVSAENKVRVKEEIKIPPRSEYVCHATQNLCKPGKELLIEPEETNIYGLMAARVLTKSEKVIPIRLINIANTTVTIPKRTVIGRAEVFEGQTENKQNLTEFIDRRLREIEIKEVECLANLIKIINEYSQGRVSRRQDEIQVKRMELQRIKERIMKIARQENRNTERREVPEKTRSQCDIIHNICNCNWAKPTKDEEDNNMGIQWDSMQQSEPHKLEDHFDLEHLDENTKKQMISILEEYKDIFLLKGAKLGCTHKVKHKIITEEVPPIAKTAYRVPFSQKELLQKELAKMLEEGVIEPSDSPWSSPVVIVPKKSEKGENKIRVCIDFRGLNEVTKKDHFPVANMQETLDQLGNANLFTTLDLASGYWQVELEENDKEKTAFTTGGQHYQFTKMAFGLANAPSTFQRLMNSVLAGLTGERCLVYLDDVIIFNGEGTADHIARLTKVFDRLRKANLKLQPNKCKFLKSETKYLGHVISQHGIKPEPEKISTIRNYPIPKSVKEIRAFLGLVGFYRRFITRFAKTAVPLTQLTKKDEEFTWTKDCQEAFETLREALCTESLLAHPDFNKEFILSTDASGLAASAILSQKQNGYERPIAFASRQLNKAETNYDTSERECLAIIWGVKHYRCYLYGRKFTIITDHKPLKWLMSLKDPNSRLMRWSLLLSEFEYEVLHKPGKKHINADVLSRIPINSVSNTDNIYLPIWDRDKIKKLQGNDEEIRKLTSKEGFFQDEEGLKFKEKTGEERNHKLVIPKEMSFQVIHDYHNLPYAGHQAHEKTLKRIKDKFWWKNMNTEIKEYCDKCHSCNERKTPSNLKPAPLQVFQEITAPFQRTSMDIVGPLVTSRKGNKYILTFQDHFSKYPEAFAIPDQTAETIARIFAQEIISRHGAPRQLLTDQGKNFISNTMKEVCKLFNVEKLQTTAYRPQTNGVIERSHRVFKDMLSHFISRDQTDWDEWLPYVLMAYRSAVHKSTGETPFFVMHGRDMEMPYDDISRPRTLRYDYDDNYAAELRERMRIVFERVKSQLKETTEQRNKQFNKKAEQTDFEIGDRVYFHDPTKIQLAGTSKKLVKPWTGPYRIKEKLSAVNYRIVEETGKRNMVVHVNRLKPFKAVIEEVQEEEIGMESSTQIEKIKAPTTVELEAMRRQLEAEESHTLAPQHLSPSRIHTRSRGPVTEQPWIWSPANQ